MFFWEPNLLNPYCLVIFKLPFFRKLAALEPGEMAFSRAGIIKKMKNCHFQAIEVEYCDFLLPNTPIFLVGFLIWWGNILERMPWVNLLSQSLFIKGAGNNESRKSKP